MFPIEEIGRIARVQVHSLESWMWSDSCRCPLPQTTHVSLTVEIGASSHGSRVPVREADVCAGQVDEKIVRIGC